MAATSSDFDALLKMAGIPNLDPAQGPVAPPIGPPQGTRGLTPPVIPEGVTGEAFRNEYVRQGMQTSGQRLAENTLQTGTPEPQGDLARGWGAGLEQTKALVFGAGAALTDIVGADESRDYLLGEYLHHMHEAEKVRSYGRPDRGHQHVRRFH